MMARQKIIEGISLEHLLRGIADIVPENERVITGICTDSRKVKPGDVFIAYTGSKTSGIDYIDEAIAKGAIIILTESLSVSTKKGYSVPLIPIANLRDKVGVIASRFFGEPSKEINVIGITGTNGKTSIACYLGQALARHSAVPVGYIGTLGLGRFDNLQGSKNTTPDPITIHSTLAELKEQGAKNVVMEVSSHALDQSRVTGIDFNIAVFTGLSRDHLDYHGDMAVYAEAKKKLFLTEGLKFGIINSDDSYGKELIESLHDKITVVDYGITDEELMSRSELPRVRATIRRQELGFLTLGIVSPWGKGEMTVALTGRFNAYNLLAVLSVLCLMDIPFNSVLEYLSALHNVPGRMEVFGGIRSPKVIVDYSHTPDALMQALLVLREQCRGKLICVFGCGGDRDQGKRPEMGRIACEYADHVVLTNDNPRSESPEKIIQDIRKGMASSAPVEIESDRAKAIVLAINMAALEDIILVAGKGHETYQEIGSKRYPFSDRQLVRNLLEGKS